MGTKVTVQMIADSMADKLGLTRKSADAFSKAFWNVIIEGLDADGIVRIKGFGTFKLVDISSRESVNVATGERFVIQGHKRVSFVPDDAANLFFTETVSDDGAEADEEQAGVDDVVSDESGDEDIASDIENTAQEASVVEAVTEMVVSAETVADVSSAEPNAVSEESTVEALESVENNEADGKPEPENNNDSGENSDTSNNDEPEYEERPVDEFSNIDLIISTPESIEDAKRRLEEARGYAEATALEAQKAKEEMVRLEQLVDRLVSNLAPASGQASAEKVDVLPNADTEQNEDNVAEKTESNDDYVSNDDSNKNGKKRNNKIVAFASVIAVLIVTGAIAVYMFVTNGNNSSQIPAEKEKTVAKVQNKPVKIVQDSTKVKTAKVDSAKIEDKIKQEVLDSLKNLRAKAVADSIAKAEHAKPAHPAEYVIKKGESLTRVSQKFYGTKDSVYAIIKANRFKNPDNVPVGTTIKLP